MHLKAPFFSRAPHTRLRRIAACVLVSLSLAAATPGRAADILDIFEQARQNDALFGADTASYQAQQQAPTTARSELLPSLSASAGVGRKRSALSGSGQFVAQGDASYDSTEYGLSLSQTIYDRTKFLGYKQAQVSAQQSDIEYAIAQQDLIIRVVVRYFAVLAAQDNVDLTVANRKSLKQQLELADERLAVGLGTTTDLFDAQARYSIAEAEEIDAYTILENANQALAELIGHVPTTALKRLKPDTPLLYPNPNDLEAWVARALENNLELAAAKKKEEFALQEIKREQAGHLPSLDFVVGHGVIDDDGSVAGGALKRESTDALVRLSLPILQGGAVVSRTKASRYRYQAAQQLVESARRSAERTARASFLNTTTRIRQVEAFRQAVVASESALEAKRESFKAGLETNIDVLNAQRDLFRAQRDYLARRYDYILDRLELEQVVGDLDDNDIVQVNAWLQ